MIISISSFHFFFSSFDHRKGKVVSRVVGQEGYSKVAKFLNVSSKELHSAQILQLCALNKIKKQLNTGNQSNKNR